VISLAQTDDERRAIERFWIDQFDDWDVHMNIICDAADDHIYLPLVAQVQVDGRLVAAAFTRPLRSLAQQANDPSDPLAVDAKRLLPRYVELDTMAVHRDFQGRGYGQAMLDFLEPMLAKRGGRMLFGSVTSHQKEAFLRSYYERLGFACLREGEPLPPFGGFNPEHRDQDSVRFFFWKRLRSVSSAS
jgi:GNAT superfamily N-acetyltransferase